MQVLNLCLAIHPKTIGSTSWLAFVCVRRIAPGRPLPGPFSQELCFTSELGSLKDKSLRTYSSIQPVQASYSEFES